MDIIHFLDPLPEIDEEHQPSLGWYQGAGRTEMICSDNESCAVYYSWTPEQMLAFGLACVAVAMRAMEIRVATTPPEEA
jgi:hypothetical protein